MPAGSIRLPVPQNEDNKRELNRVLREAELKKWTARCSEARVGDWNGTIGKFIGIKAEK
jgi:hypothetical protein